MNTLENLPNDMLVEIFSKVGNDSAMLLENIKLRYSKTTFSKKKKYIYIYTHTN